MKPKRKLTVLLQVLIVQAQQRRIQVLRRRQRAQPLLLLRQHQHRVVPLMQKPMAFGRLVRIITQLGMLNQKPKTAFVQVIFICHSVLKLVRQG